MTTSEELDSPPLGQLRHRRTVRSCDVCRDRKVKCDGAQNAEGSCSNCVAFGATCTYLQEPKKRGRKNGIALTDQLKKEIVELKAENASLKTKLQSLSTLCSICSQPLQASHMPNEQFNNNESNGGSTETETDEQVDEQEGIEELNIRLGPLALESHNNAFVGASSPFALAGNVVAMQEKHLGRQLLTHPGRPLFWRILPWEQETYDPHPQYIFPANDLIDSLLEQYRANIHPILPILHYPSFALSVAQGLHSSDSEFGGALLAVLAVASRFSSDSRVFVNGDVSLSAGWMFASQIRVQPKMFHRSIYEVQMYCLLSIFALGTSAPRLPGSTSGLVFGLFSKVAVTAKSAGALGPGHIRAMEASVLPSLNEISAFAWAGDPLCTQTSFCEVEPIQEIDDEFWERGFVQPLGKPSQLSYFSLELRLCDILHHVNRRLYGSKKTKKLLRLDGPDWEQKTVAEFDSAMNDFLDSVPLHLQWNPENPALQGTFFDQSAILYLTYHYVRISIHRRYIQKATISPSFYICTCAARAIINIADTWFRRCKRYPPSIFVDAIFMASIILILNFHLSKTKRPGSSKEVTKDLAPVAIALDILKFIESRSQPVGRIWELLHQLWLHEHPFERRFAESVPSTELPSLPDYLQGGPQLHPPTSHRESSALNVTFSQTPSFEPGTSIDQLLSAADPFNALNCLLDTEVMAMLMATTTDHVANMDDWDVYMSEDRNVYSPDMNWN
ncbi:fungal-trans domain-containing protein [Favolaschia claudopus]|uniref:Fungal-trans domain-containing protein n=1 Tax=Favolaschia claudopus TaxID=2862362 RepID=A0AAV9ZZP8_9AGAR